MRRVVIVCLLVASLVISTVPLALEEHSTILPVRWSEVPANLTPTTAIPTQPSVIWDEAHTNGWANANRGPNEINRIIIHVTQGSYSGAISWFNNPDAGVAAHYVINNQDAIYSSNQNYPDGEITQMVADADIGYHNANANSNSIGIEHSAYLDPNQGYKVSGNFSQAMYNSSAHLVAWLTYQYDIPVNRNFIVGHSEDENFGGTSSHQDPGPDWNWNYYLGLIESIRGSQYEIPINRVIEVTNQTEIRAAPFNGASDQGIAQIGEQYHAVGWCYCAGLNYVRIWFDGSDYSWIETSSVRAVSSASLYYVDLSDNYDWLNVRDSPSGNDLGNVFAGQSYVAFSENTWNEFYFAGLPTAFAHSDYLAQINWTQPQIMAPNISQPNPELEVDETAEWRFIPTWEEMVMLPRYSFTLQNPNGTVEFSVSDFTSNFSLSYSTRVGVWNWSLAFFDVLGEESVVVNGGYTVVEPVVEDVEGCTDEGALNFDANATVDDGSCEYPVPPVIEVEGCTDYNASNFQENATIDDGSCEYLEIGPEEVYGCTYQNATNFQENATVDDGSCVFEQDQPEPEPEPEAEPVSGCTYQHALNYDSLAEIDDGSCIFEEQNQQQNQDGGGAGEEIHGDTEADTGSESVSGANSTLMIGFAGVVLLALLVLAVTLILWRE